jgi:2-polyprenyl-3-methyl-5-hydroxy-6-metoxy-1,4-benzoquinol methylase
MYTEQECAARWAALLAPRLGSVREEIVDELSRYLEIAPDIVRGRLKDATTAFAEEWRAKVRNPRDAASVVKFYDESTTELFDLAEWHASDAIHYRTLSCADFALARGARRALDYGSGIGSDAIALAGMGFEVTLADVSGTLLEFARWRCRDRGFDVRTVDLKRQPLPADTFDAALCFDVLEHVPNPIGTVRRIRRSMRPGGLLFLHAPFGVDRDRPMHIVDKDVVSPWIRALGLRWRLDIEAQFPRWLWAPHVYESVAIPLSDRVGYFLHDVAWPSDATRALARLYRRVVPSALRRAGA